MTLNFELQLLQALKDIANRIEDLNDSVNFVSEQLCASERLWLSEELKKSEDNEQQPQS